MLDAVKFSIKVFPQVISGPAGKRAERRQVQSCSLNLRRGRNRTWPAGSQQVTRVERESQEGPQETGHEFDVVEEKSIKHLFFFYILWGSEKFRSLPRGLSSTLSPTSPRSTTWENLFVSKFCHLLWGDHPLRLLTGFSSLCGKRQGKRGVRHRGERCEERQQGQEGDLPSAMWAPGDCWSSDDNSSDFGLAVTLGVCWTVRKLNKARFRNRGPRR